MALTRPGEAAEAFRAGAVLEPKSKLWTPLVEKAVKAASEAPAKPTNGVTTNTSSSTRSTSSPSTTTTTTTTKKVSEITPSTAKAPATTTASSSGSSGGETGSEMKGYKKTADGRLTTYFNNDLSEEAKALIGDIAPKKLEPAAAAPGAEGAGGNAASAWNKAGTWESRDMTRLVCVPPCGLALSGRGRRRERARNFVGFSPLGFFRVGGGRALSTVTRSLFALVLACFRCSPSESVLSSCRLLVGWCVPR